MCVFVVGALCWCPSIPCSDVFRTTRAICSELGSSCSRLPGILRRDMKAQRVLFFTDRGIHRLGLLSEPIAAPARAGLEVHVKRLAGFRRTPQIVLAAVQIANKNKSDAVVGFGGMFNGCGEACCLFGRVYNATTGRYTHASCGSGIIL
jgi:hypothetical protein